MTPPFGDPESFNLRQALQLAAEERPRESPVVASVREATARAVSRQRDVDTAELAEALAVIVARLDSDPTRVLASGYGRLIVAWAERLR